MNNFLPAILMRDFVTKLCQKEQCRVLKFYHQNGKNVHFCTYTVFLNQNYVTHTWALNDFEMNGKMSKFGADPT